jgi:hypothetical protein
MKNILLIVIIAAAHFTVSKLTPSMTLLLMDSGIKDAVATGFLIKLLVIMTKLLYFPLLTLSLYSRQWFPGYWINIVIIANSLLWGAGIFFFITLFRKFRHPV